VHRDVEAEHQLLFRTATEQELRSIPAPKEGNLKATLFDELRENKHNISNINGSFSIAELDGGSVVGYTLFIRGHEKGPGGEQRVDKLTQEGTRVFGSLKRGPDIARTTASMAQNPGVELSREEMAEYTMGMKLPLPQGITYANDIYIIEK
jgi:hypothetical protein